MKKMGSAADITQRVLDRCRDMGFALSGACDARPTEREQEVRDWLASGKHGEMGYLARNLELRLDPAKMLPGARAIICVADCYHVETPKPSNAETPKHRPRGKIARYARGKDYHKVMRDRLRKLCKELAGEFPQEQFRACVDTAPVLEREYAQRAGLGAIGKNTLLLQRGAGSWLLLGEIITTLPLAASRSADPDPCGSCTRCIDACPTQAISRDGWQLDATRCISYLTIEHRSMIDAQFHEAMDDWVFGCDICQEVCPHNQEKENPLARSRRAAAHPAYQPQRESFDLLEVLGWDEETWRQATINSAMRRARLDMMKRNALIAADNALRRGMGSQALREKVQALGTAADESPLVRETAHQVLQRFK